MKLTVGFIPEHFSTPLVLAEKHGFFKKLGVEVEFVPYPSGSGHLIQSLKDGSINIAVGLTEAFIRSIATGSTEFKIVGTYVESPLQWAISTGGKRSDLNGIADLEGSKCGISRPGSGSDVMSRVFQVEQEFSEPFKYVVNHDFARLRKSVNDGDSDFFMWEHFTSKRYFDNGEIKRLGDIYTPWPSWVVVSSTSVPKDERTKFVTAVNEGIQYFENHHEEAIKSIYTTLDYTEEDARSWLQTVKFSTDAGRIDPAVIEHTVIVLQEAANLPASALNLDYNF